MVRHEHHEDCDNSSQNHFMHSILLQKPTHNAMQPPRALLKIFCVSDDVASS